MNHFNLKIAAIWTSVFLIIILIMAAQASAATPESTEFRLQEAPDTTPMNPPSSTGDSKGQVGFNSDLELLLDDGSPEQLIGVTNDTSSHPFIWLNRFTPQSSDFPFQTQCAPPA